MANEMKEEFGPPDIKLEGLEIWINGRQFPKNKDYWDGNMLRVTAHCSRAMASVWVSGVVHIVELQRWESQSKYLLESLQGEVKLNCRDIELAVSLKALSLGHIEMKVSISPDQMTQGHWFQFGIDQSYLGPLQAQFKKILHKYPLIGSP